MSTSASCSAAEKDTDSNDDDEGFKYPVKVSNIFFVYLISNLFKTC
jgi:hypothetical protein